MFEWYSIIKKQVASRYMLARERVGLTMDYILDRMEEIIKAMSNYQFGLIDALCSYIVEGVSCCIRVITHDDQ